jgi:hypothetical protein
MRLAAVNQKGAELRLGVHRRVAGVEFLRRWTTVSVGSTK